MHFYLISFNHNKMNKWLKIKYFQKLLTFFLNNGRKLEQDFNLFKKEPKFW